MPLALRDLDLPVALRPVPAALAAPAAAPELTSNPASQTAQAIARVILDGFDRHYHRFRALSQGAAVHFQRGDFESLWEDSRARIDLYDRTVAEVVADVAQGYPQARLSDALWPPVKLAFIQLLYGHLQPECAETFYNSVACRVLHRSSYNNQHLFVRPAVSTEHLDGDEPSYRGYYPQEVGLRAALRAILSDTQVDGRLGLPFEDLSRDVRRLLRALLREARAAGWALLRRAQPNLQIQVLSSLFFRQQAAYLVGRVVNGGAELPFAIVLRRSSAAQVYVDALLSRVEHIAPLFSLARAYFLVDLEVPAAYVRFLSWLMPGKTQAELYTALGLHKQGKTLFYRDLQEHLRHSRDRFVLAPGSRGMVMLVFTLPSFPYVFKVIRDRFEYPKEATTQSRVKAKYLLVKYHDRAGRMADTLEYSDVSFPRARFDPGLLAELLRLAPSSLELDGERVVIRHLYIERRLVPLDVYLKGADDEGRRRGVREFAAAIREMAAANIFPGDLLPKNFGVTRYGRVVFYDYDDICYLTECRFRRIPPPQSYDEEVAEEPYYSVAPGDVFPEEFPTFLFPPGAARDDLLREGRDIIDVEFWQAAQERARRGPLAEVVPYPDALRFSRPAEGTF